MKTERELKIHEMSGYHYRPTPTIMLKGQWLSAFGFEAGSRVKVCCEDKKITLSLIPSTDVAARFAGGGLKAEF